MSMQDGAPPKPKRHAIVCTVPGHGELSERDQRLIAQFIDRALLRDAKEAQGDVGTNI